MICVVQSAKVIWIETLFGLKPWTIALQHEGYIRLMK